MTTNIHQDLNLAMVDPWLLKPYYRIDDANEFEA